MKLKIEGVSKMELISKLAAYSILYGFLAINYIDLIVPGSAVPGYHLWLTIQYFVPFVPMLFVLGFDDWELVLSMGLLGSPLNDLGYYPAAILFFRRPVDLLEWYKFQLGFRGFEVQWNFNAEPLFTLPVSSLLMGASIYENCCSILALCKVVDGVRAKRSLFALTFVLFSPPSCLAWQRT